VTTSSSRALAPIVAGLLALAGSLGATVYLHRAAAAALEQVFQARLRGAGQTAARLLDPAAAAPAALREIMTANGLEGALLVSPSRRVLADATGPAEGAVDLLRVDAARIARALAGEASVDFGYDVGDVPVATGFFPVRARGGGVEAILVLEAGQAFAAARGDLRRALWGGIGLSLLAGLAMAALAVQWSRAEARRRRAAELAARGEILERMAAMAAHEIRNPLTVIRSAAELVRTRSGGALGPRDQEALADVLEEVERLQRLTEDLLDLSREPQLAPANIDLAEVASEAARALQRTNPAVTVEVATVPLPTCADSARLRQVFANLLGNAVQAGGRRLEVRCRIRDGQALVEVRDDGPGIAPGMRHRLFEPFATSRAAGRGLGLVVSRRIVERQGGQLTLLADGRPGAAFEVRLPLRAVKGS
jgi:signal transduction histidine kinase